MNSEIYDGWVIHSQLDSGEIADIYAELSDVMLDSSVWDSLGQMAAASGQDIGDLGLDEAKAELDKSVEDIRNSDMTLDCDYSIADGKLIRMLIAPSGKDIQEDLEANIDLYEGNMITCTLSSGDSTVLISSEAASEKGSYSHVLKLKADGETMTVTTSWVGNRLDVSAVAEGEERLALSGDFGVSADGFYLTDGELSYNLPDSGAATVPITLKYTSGTTVATPTELKNIFEMSESDIMGLLLSISAMTGSM